MGVALGVTDVRRVLHAMVGLTLLAVPTVATAQTEIPPPVVQSLKGPESPEAGTPWLGAAAGAAIAVVGLNALTGGALLTPAVGPTLSGVLGGAWLGTAALPPLSAQALFETTAAVASGVSGGLVGYWLADR